jgi:ectoine hydroxylase-related dioxygenase (phytanoyl-CoA dioxygenase family)
MLGSARSRDIHRKGLLATTQELDVPALTSDYALSDDAIAAYRRDGHVKLPAVVTREELAAYRPAIVEATYRYNQETRSLQERDTYARAFLQVMNLWTKDDMVRQFVLARRFGKIAADLMGVEGVRLYHDQALFKESGGGYTPMHQDQYYWPLDTDHTITMWMPLVDLPADVGGMRFASGSQSAGFLGELPISDRSEEVLARLIGERKLGLHETGAINAGDATFHAGWTLHGAPPNTSPMMREVMTIIYFADGTRIRDPESEGQRNDLNAWLPGLEPGELAASGLNPLVYSKG